MWVHSMGMNTHVKLEDPESFIFAHLAKNEHMNYMGYDGDISPIICELQRSPTLPNWHTKSYLGSFHGSGYTCIF